MFIILISLSESIITFYWIASSGGLALHLISLGLNSLTLLKKSSPMELQPIPQETSMLQAWHMARVRRIPPLNKYNPSGSKQWTKQLGTSNHDYGRGIDSDSSGNVYVAWETSSGLDGNSSSGGEDFFLVKYNSSGAKQWTKQLGTSSNERANGVSTDSSGNVYVAGYTEGGLDGNSNSGNKDLFIVKYNSDRNKQ